MESVPVCIWLYHLRNITIFIITDRGIWINHGYSLSNFITDPVTLSLDFINVTILCKYFKSEPNCLVIKLSAVGFLGVAQRVSYKRNNTSSTFLAAFQTINFVISLVIFQLFKMLYLKQFQNVRRVHWSGYIAMALASSVRCQGNDL